MYYTLISTQKLIFAEKYIRLSFWNFYGIICQLLSLIKLVGATNSARLSFTQEGSCRQEFETQLSLHSFAHPVTKENNIILHYFNNII